ncbi:DcaP family trimeric outer membrane transporter [Chryseobacterium sp.]|uniref:DcaP family trimeric outer membrane transporter n=1 Tax=Chryseobacterium sp. TaxID=1871047 RepID=UPI0025C1C3DA|nr:DcaP family trimeric outer membrane transporter [Chryseobacterium sp.]
MKKNYLGFMTSLSFITLFSIKINAQTTIISKKDNQETSGDNWSVYLKGFIQADAMLDFQSMGFKDGFAATSITLPQNNTTSSNFSVKQSQVGFGIEDSKRDLSAYAEIDFFGPNGTTAPRFRKGYIQWKNWLVGQTWSNFSDISAFPNMFDFAGPNGFLFSRRIQIRYSKKFAPHHDLSISLEDPKYPSITLPEDTLLWKKKPLIPTFTTMYRYGNENSYIKVGGILVPISYERRDKTEDPYNTHTILGYGALISGRYDLNPSNNIRFQSSYGKGYSNTNQVLDGEKYDAIPNPQNGNALETLSLFNILGIYEHWWSPKWSSVAYYSYSQVGKKSFIPGDMLRNFQNGGLNIVFQPYKKLRIGVEGNYGSVQKFNTQQGHAFRIQCSSSLNF